MRKHVFALLLGIVLLISFASLSCVPQSTASTAPTDGIAYKSDVKVVQDQVTAQNQQIITIAGKSGVSQADVQTAINASLADYTKKSDLDAAIAAYLVAHPVTKTSTTSPSNSTPSPGSEQVATNKELELYLTEINPASDALIFSESQSLRMDFDVLNTNSSSSHTFEITIYLYPQDPESNYNVTGLDIFSDVSLTAISSAPAIFPSSEALTIRCQNGWVGKGDTTSFTVTGVVHVSGSAEFDYDYSVRQTN